MESFESKLIDYDSKTYRVYHQDEKYCYLIDFNATTLAFRVIETEVLKAALKTGDAAIPENQRLCLIEPSVMENLPAEVKERFEKYKAFIKEIEEHTGPDFLAMAGKKSKPWFEDIYTSTGVAKSTALRIVRRYLQSSPKLNGLFDPNTIKVFNHKPKAYNGRGRKTTDGKRAYRITDKDIDNMEEAVNVLKGGQHRSIRDAYRWMIDTYYSSVTTLPSNINSEARVIKRPFAPGQRVSERQFRNYLSGRKEELDEAKLGARAFRNNRRRLFGRPSSDLPYPGYLVEVDALDVDLNIVSEYNRDKAISRPTIYAMRDDLTGMILAVAVTLEKNSVAGVTRLVMNMLEDKVKLAASFGIKIENDVWPSFILPGAWRTDHGSDFMAKDLENALVSIGVRKESVPPGTGSYKGKIESLFKVFYTKTKPHLEGHGLVSREYGGNDTDGSCLPLSGLWELVVRFVIWFNTHPYQSDERKLTPAMLKEENVSNTSVFLWKYFTRHNGNPRIIDENERTQVLFNLMEQAKISIQRDGIHYKKLVYDEPYDDPDLSLEISLCSINAKKKCEIVFRCDPATVGYLYYLKEGKLMRCTLNKQRSGFDFMVTGLSGSQRFMTWDEYEDFRSAEKALKKKDDEKALVGEIELAKDTSAIIQRFTKDTRSSVRNMRENHLLERQEDNSRNTLVPEIPCETEEEKIESPDELIRDEYWDDDPFVSISNRVNGSYKY